MVAVHSSCAGLINAGFLAARKAMRSLGRQACLVVATKLDRMRRAVLKLMFPDAWIGKWARGLDAFCGPRTDILVISWPCMPYSDTNVDGNVPVGVAEKRRRA